MFLLAVFRILYIIWLNILPLMNNIFPPSPRKRILHQIKLFFKLYLKVLIPFLSQILQTHSNTQEKTRRLKHKNKLPF